MYIQQLQTRWALITCAVLVCLIGLGSFFDVQAQSGRKIVKPALTINPQVKFTGLRVEQRDLKFGESFDAEANWVKNLTVKLENISGKRIVFLSVGVNFPETRSTGNMMSYQIMLGEMPGRKMKDSKPFSLMPKETLEVSLENDKIVKFVSARQPLETIHEVELEIGLVVFEDKTAWSSGNLMRPDPDNPGRYKPIENEQE